MPAIPLEPTLEDRIAARRAGLFKLDPRFGDAVFAGCGAFQAGDYFHDSSHYGNHGTLEPNAATGPQWEWSEELGRWGLRFDGANDCVELPANPSLNVTSDITFSFWLATTSPSNQHILRGYNLSGFAGYGVSLGQIATGKVAYWNGSSWVGGNSAINDGVLRHLAITVAGTVATFFVSGIADGTATTSPPTSYVGTRILGARNPADGVIIGSLFDPLIFPRALSPDEIWWLAQRENHPIVPLRERWQFLVDPDTLPPDSPGLEYTMPRSRLHYTLPDGRLQATMPRGRLHYTMPRE